MSLLGRQQRIGAALTLFLAATSREAMGAEAMIVGDAVCGGQPTVVTFAQWVDGPDSVASVVTEAHWRIDHRRLPGTVCPAFLVDPSTTRLFVRLERADGSLASIPQFEMYSLPLAAGGGTAIGHYTGDYRLFLSTEAAASGFFK